MDARLARVAGGDDRLGVFTVGEIVTTIEVLREARALVAKGWCQNENAFNSEGKMVHARDPSACRWCVNGALMVASGGVIPCQSTAWDRIRDSNRIPLALDEWNDEPERTQAEVVAAFDRAIASLEPFA